MKLWGLLQQLFDGYRPIDELYNAVTGLGLGGAKEPIRGWV